VEGLSPARASDKWGFINAAGNWVIPPKYLSAEHFSEGLAKVFLDSKRGALFAFIDQSRKIIIELAKGVSSDLSAKAWLLCASLAISASGK
jgi:hypothetical protein